jgi:hypothetical protein
LSSDRDAPVALRLNDPDRGINDLGVVMLPNESNNDEARLRRSSYGNCSFDAHKDDMEVIGSACRLWTEKRTDPRYSHFYFISGDRKCCKKALDYFKQNDLEIEVLFARRCDSSGIRGIRDVAQLLRP